MSGKATILVTRHSGEAAQTIAEIEALGFAMLHQPMLEMEALDFTVPDMRSYAGLLFTSAQGVRFFTQRCTGRDVPVFCVGDHTAQDARDAGFADVRSAAGDAQALAELVAGSAQAGEVYLHIRGAHVAAPLHVLLAGHGVRTDILMVYTARKIEKFSEGTRHAFENGLIDCVTFFSRRTAESFMEAIAQNGLERALERIKCLSISTGVLECVQSAPWQKTYVAAQPTRAAMLDALRLIREKEIQQ